MHIVYNLYIYFFILIFWLIINSNFNFIVINEEFIVFVTLTLLFLSICIFFKKFIQRFFFFSIEKFLFLFLFNIMVCRNNLFFLKLNLRSYFFFFWNLILKVLFLGFTIFLFEIIFNKTFISLNLFYLFLLKLFNNYIQKSIFIIERVLLKLNTQYFYFKKLRIKKLVFNFNNVKFFI
jgi:hypothetical protein